ncbi:MAG: hypothetical protein WCG26_08320 [Chloroflexales bacterium]
MGSAAEIATISLSQGLTQKVPRIIIATVSTHLTVTQRHLKKPHGVIKLNIRPVSRLPTAAGMITQSSISLSAIITT